MPNDVSQGKYTQHKAEEDLAQLNDTRRTCGQDDKAVIQGAGQGNETGLWCAHGAESETF